MSIEIFDLISAAVLTVCGICTLYTGILRRKNRKANNVFIVILILCSIAFVVSPFIKPNDINSLPSDYGFMMFAFSYTAMTLLYIAVYTFSFRKNTDRMQALVFTFSVFIAFTTLLSAVMLIVIVAFDLFMMIPKY